MATTQEILKELEIILESTINRLIKIDCDIKTIGLVVQALKEIRKANLQDLNFIHEDADERYS